MSRQGRPNESRCHNLFRASFSDNIGVIVGRLLVAPGGGSGRIGPVGVCAAAAQEKSNASMQQAFAGKLPLEARGLDGTDMIPLKCKAGELPGGVGAGVEINAVRKDLRLGDWRMAVHHDLFERAGMFEKVVSYPQQIMSALLCQRYARANAGMHEEIISADVGIAQPLQEIAVTARQHAVE